MSAEELVEAPLIEDRIQELIPDARLHKMDTEGDGRQVILWGPPGTGKTTALMTLLDAHLKAGAPSHQIMVATFTRNARKEVKDRLATRFGLLDSELPWVRTIHSSAYRLLELGGEKVMGPRSLEEFSLDSGYELRGQLAQRNVDDPFGTQSVETFGDWCYIAEELRRARRLTYGQAERYFRPPGIASGWDAAAAEAFSIAYDGWKRAHYLLDFSDMLEQIIDNQIRPDIHWMFVDEAQDLTPLQWEVIDVWAQGLTRQFVFGDDDQAIFAFAGADPKALWARPGHQLVLSHSYRLRANIHAEANLIIRKTRERVIKEFEPHAEGGVVREEWGWDLIDYRQEGTWLLLGRNRVFLEDARKQLRDSGIPFADRTSAAGLPDPNGMRGRALSALLELHEGRLLTQRSLIRQLRDQVRPALWPDDRIGPGLVWGVLDLVEAGADPKLVNLIASDPLSALKGSVDDRAYLHKVWKSWGLEALRARPRIELATIHGVKGEEADHVVVSTAMTRRTHDDYSMDPDAEHRVFYVAATRAKQTLTWLQGQSRTFYRR